MWRKWNMYATANSCLLLIKIFKYCGWKWILNKYLFILEATINLYFNSHYHCPPYNRVSVATTIWSGIDNIKGNAFLILLVMSVGQRCCRRHPLCAKNTHLTVSHPNSSVWREYQQQPNEDPKSEEQRPIYSDCLHTFRPFTHLPNRCAACPSDVFQMCQCIENK